MFWHIVRYTENVRKKPETSSKTTFWTIFCSEKSERILENTPINILLATAKDFFEFSHKQQLKTSKKPNRDNPAVRVFYLEADEVGKVKNNILESRVEKPRALHVRKNIRLILNKHVCLGKIQGIRAMHEFQPISYTTVNCRSTSRSTQTRTYSLK